MHISQGSAHLPATSSRNLFFGAEPMFHMVGSSLRVRGPLPTVVGSFLPVSLAMRPLSIAAAKLNGRVVGSPVEERGEGPEPFEKGYARS